MTKIIYEINVQDLVDELKEEGSVKIEFYEGNDYMIFSKYAFGFPDLVKHIEYFELCGFEECENIEDYRNWLKGCWYDGVEIYKNDNYQGKIYVNWI